MVKVRYGEGSASHAGPESCVAAREGRGEALTGEGAGRVSSREITCPPAQVGGPPGCRRDRRTRKATPARRHGETCPDPARSETLRTHRNILHGSREAPRSPRGSPPRGRIGKPQGTRR